MRALRFAALGFLVVALAGASLIVSDRLVAKAATEEVGGATAAVSPDSPSAARSRPGPEVTSNSDSRRNEHQGTLTALPSVATSRGVPMAGGVSGPLSSSARPP